MNESKRHILGRAFGVLVALWLCGCTQETTPTPPVDASDTSTQINEDLDTENPPSPDAEDTWESTDAKSPGEPNPPSPDTLEEDATSEDAETADTEVAPPEDAIGNEDPLDGMELSPDITQEVPTEWPYGDEDHPVGVMVLEDDIVTDVGRTLRTMVWYPAAATEEDAFPLYKYIQIMVGTAKKNPPIAPGGPWPLILFSHGNQGIKEQSFFMTEFLASKGYIVISPDHELNTLFDYESSAMPEVAIQRARDLSATIDRFESPLPSDPAWFSDSVDLNHIGATGHSFGGYTSLMIGGTQILITDEVLAECEAQSSFSCNMLLDVGITAIDNYDPRVSAVLPMAPGGYPLFGPEGMASHKVPTLILCGNADEMTPLETESQPAYDGINTEKYLWVIEGGKHFIFSDLCLIPGISELADFGDFGFVCGPENPVPHPELHPHINNVAEAFFDWYLMGDDTHMHLLTKDGAEAQHPSIRFFAPEDQASP